MDKKFNLNGAEIELSKEKLQSMLKEYDKSNKPVWEIKADEDGVIWLCRNNKKRELLLMRSGEDGTCNLSSISRDIAKAMDDLVGGKDLLNKGVVGYCVYYDLFAKQWNYNFSFIKTNEKHFKTLVMADWAVEILNESKDMDEWIERMSI